MRLIDIDPFMMDAFDLDWVKLTLLVWAEKESGARDDFTSEQRPRHDNSNTSNLVEAVYQELHGVGAQTKLTRRVHSRFEE